MFQHLRSHSLSLQILLPILAFLPYLIFFFIAEIPQPNTHNAQGWIYNNWLMGLDHKPWLFLLLGWALNLLTAYSLYWLNIRFEVIGKRTVYISFLFSVLALTPLGFHTVHPGMLGGVFLLISLVFLFFIYHHNQTQAYLFNAGLFWGLSILVYPPFLAMLPLYLLGARFVRYTRGRDFILLITGLLTPVWIWVAFSYLSGEINFQWLSVLQWAELRKTWPPEFPGRPLLWYLLIGFIGLVLLLNLNLFRVKKDVGRRVLTLMGQLIRLCHAILLIFERVSIEVLWVALVPITFLLSVAAFNSRRPIVSDLIFICFFIFMILFQLNLVI